MWINDWIIIYYINYILFISSFFFIFKSPKVLKFLTKFGQIIIIGIFLVSYYYSNKDKEDKIKYIQETPFLPVVI